MSFLVTRRRLILGLKDSVTGWYTKHFIPETIEAYAEDRGTSTGYLPAGVYAKLDAVCISGYPLNEGDEIKTDDGRFYEVKAVKEVFGPADNACYVVADLVKLPLHELSFSSVAPSVNDARYNMKVYWDTYIDITYLQDKPFLVCYSDPDYPYSRLFKDKGLEIVFTVETSRTTPLIGTDLTPYNYREQVNTHVITLDTKLNHLGQAELRRVIENHPLGSQRTFTSSEPRIHHLGSMQVYDSTFTVNYTRGLT